MSSLTGLDPRGSGGESDTNVVPALMDDETLDEGDEEDEEDEENEDAEVDENLQGFIVDEPLESEIEEEDDEDGDENEDDDEPGLDEDDLDLIAENTGIRPVVVPHPPLAVPKFRRLKKHVGFENEDVKNEAEDDIVFAKERESLHLFDDDYDDGGLGHRSDVDARHPKRLRKQDDRELQEGDDEDWGSDEDNVADQETYGLDPDTIAYIAEVFGDVGTIMEILGRRNFSEDGTEEDAGLQKATDTKIASEEIITEVPDAPESSESSEKTNADTSRRPAAREPEEAAREYLTDTDAAICRTDKPERHVVRYKNRPCSYSNETLKTEAGWIAWRVTTDMGLGGVVADEESLQKMYRDAFGPKSDYYNPQTTSVRQDIEETTVLFLHLLLNENLEVPTILLVHGHRLCPPITERLAWLIVDLDQEWSRLSHAASCMDLLLAQLPETDPDVVYLRSRVEQFKTEEDIDDVRHYINFCYSDLALPGLDRRRRRQAASSTGTSLGEIQKLGLDKHWKPHLLPAHLFASNIEKSENFARLVSKRSALNQTDLDVEHIPPPEPSLPGRGPEALDAWLSSLTTGLFSTASRVLEALLTLESRQLAVNVRVRESLRQWFFSVAQITTVLTPTGEAVVTLGNPNWAALNLRRKPAAELLYAEFPVVPPRPASQDLLWQQLNDRERRARQATAFLDIMHAEALGHVTVIVHPLAPNEPAPWKRVENQQQSQTQASKASQRRTKSGTSTSSSFVDDLLLRNTDAFDFSDAAALEALLDTLADLYVLSPTSTWALEVQAKILQRLIFRELLPLFRRELRYKLQRRAEACVAALCYDALRCRLDMQPYRLPDGKLFRDRDLEDVTSSLDDSDSDSGSDSDDSSSDDTEDDSVNPALWHPTPRVCGMVIERAGSSDGVRVHCVNADRGGSFMRYSYFDRLLIEAERGRRSAPSTQETDAAHSALRRFLLAGGIDVVVVGASDLLARDLHRLLTELALRIKPKRRFQVVFGSVEVPRIFAASDLCPKEYKMVYGLGACQALGLARALQDPLAAHLQLWSDHPGSPNLLLHLKYHRLQELLLRERLETTLLQAAVTTVAGVGVDVNAIRKRPHLQPLLQFVPGLGPRKASELLKRLTSPLYSRAALLKLRTTRRDTVTGIDDDFHDDAFDGSDDDSFTESLHQSSDISAAPSGRSSSRHVEFLLGTKVYHNCASFIRLSRNICLEYGAEDPLGCTRAHPIENYSSAQKTARDALEDVKRSTTAEACVIRVIQNPRCLDELDLEEYSYILNAKGQPRMLPQLEMLKRELENPYADPRYPFQEPTGEQLFYLLTQENRNDFSPGCYVTADIIESRPNGLVRLILPPSGILGDPVDVPLYMSQESGNSAARGSGGYSRKKVAADVLLPVGSVVACRIKRIEFSSFAVSVVLSDQSAAVLLAETLPWQNPGLIPTRLSAEQLREVVQNRPRHPRQRHREKEEASCMYLKAESQSSSSSYSGKPRRVVVRRRIQHPRFRLIVPSEAIEELRNGRVGDALFTPNESVLTELILFVKVCETPCMVKPILIKELDQKIPGELGKTLKIGQETFVDLDQILGQYVEVLRGNLNELFHFEKYRIRTSSLEALEAALKAAQEKKALATSAYSIEWCITIDPKHPATSPGVRFYLITVPPPSQPKDSSTFKTVPVRSSVLRDAIYVTAEGFKLWNHKERSLRRLINWWKTDGYFHRHQYIAAYNAVKQKNHLRLQEQKRCQDRSAAAPTTLSNERQTRYSGERSCNASLSQHMLR